MYMIAYIVILSTQEDTRLVAMREDPTLETVFVQALFGPLYEVFNSMAGPAIRNKCMKTILKILYHTEYVHDIVRKRVSMLAVQCFYSGLCMYTMCLLDIGSLSVCVYSTVWLG